MADASYALDGRFADRISGLLDRIDYRIATTDADREAVFRLRYEAYRREASIPANPHGRFTDAFDYSDNAQIFCAYLDGALVSSVRIHVASQRHPDCPSFGAFSDILEAEIAAGHTLVDPTRFVTDRTKAQAQAQPGLPYITLRLCWMAVEHFEAEHFLVAVRAEHQAFYRRTFRHRLICEPRPYAMLKAPICLMTTAYRESVAHVHNRYPFFRSNAFERRMLFEQHVRSDNRVAAEREPLRVVAANG